MMKTESPVEGTRKLHFEKLQSDLVIIGGGMSGACCAITAARAGLKVVLVQDRPVLGGNASSEVRLWILGATSHMGNNNRWAREGGVIDEILLENLYRNPEGNPLILDTVLLEKVTQEANIRLLLNTAVHDLDKNAADEIKMVRAFCSQNSTEYHLSAPYFVDASGDGIVGFLAGAAFRMGAEQPDEFDEKFAPDKGYGELLGHSLYFYSKDSGRPVKFIPPAFANKDIAQLPRFKSFNLKEDGCRLWWVEYGGRKDTIHESEEIKWELWSIIYGIWNHVKNSGDYADVENLALEWVGTVPGKRESRRFEGDYILTQRDVVEQREHFDVVSFGGWALDLHPADGVYSEQPGCTQWHSKGVYQIPYRTMYSRNIKNLFLGGRLISASHVAFGSTRVMATCAHNGQAVAMAASLCLKHRLAPADLVKAPYLQELQKGLIKQGQYLPKLKLDDLEDLSGKADVSVSSEYKFAGLPFGGIWKTLEFSMAQLLPLAPGKLPSITLKMKSSADTVLQIQLRNSQKTGNYTPDQVLEKLSLPIKKGEADYSVSFASLIDTDQYVFVCLMANEHLEVQCSEARVTGLVSVFNKYNKAVATSSTQSPPAYIGIDTFEFWVPERRPAGYNLAFELDSPLPIYGKENLVNGFFRPYLQPNAWVADPKDHFPTVTLAWKEAMSISEIKLYFDTDFDHPLESTLLGHPESEIPFCVRSFRIKDESGNIIYAEAENHQTICTIRMDRPVVTQKLFVELDHPVDTIPAALFGILCYGTNPVN